MTSNTWVKIVKAFRETEARLVAITYTLLTYTLCRADRKAQNM